MGTRGKKGDPGVSRDTRRVRSGSRYSCGFSVVAREGVEGREGAVHEGCVRVNLHRGGHR